MWKQNGPDHITILLFCKHRLCEKFKESFFGDGELIKDDRYPLNNWQMIPLFHPNTVQEQKRNASQQKTRSPVKSAFGISKSRWRILDYIEGRLCYTRERLSKIVMTCCEFVAEMVFKLMTFLINFTAC